MTLLPLSQNRLTIPHYPLVVYLILAFLCGAVLPIQASLNAQLARSLTSVPFAALISYAVGSLVLGGVLVTGRLGHPDWTALAKVPRWNWIGGLCGVWYIASSAYFTLILGTTLTLSFVVCGQAVTGLVADHFGWLGMPQRRLTPHRRLALALLVIALVLLTQGKR